MYKTALCLLCLTALAGCGTTPWASLQRDLTAHTTGELEAGYTYVPIDPFPVEKVPDKSCVSLGLHAPAVAKPLLEALPDNAVRMLVEQFDQEGGVTYGTSKLGAKNENYRVTVDYISADTINFSVSVQKFMKLRSAPDTADPMPVPISTPPGPLYIEGSESYKVTRIDPPNPNSPPPMTEKKLDGLVYNIPVYVGVGLRVSANVHVTGANANISGIGIIGAEAEANNVAGSLTVQTLGINGKSVAAALPIQSELNRTTAQNAIVAVGSIKSLLYADETVKAPRVVGLYLPFPGGKALVNAIVSELSKKQVEWKWPCEAPVDKPASTKTAA